MLAALSVAWVGLFAAQRLGAQSPPPSYRIGSGSMEPTLTVGQVVRADTSAYAVSHPRIGDLIVFHPPMGALTATPQCGAPQPAGAMCARPTPEESGGTFVKRIVAGPGDRVALLDGYVVRNGQLQYEPYISSCAGVDPCNFPQALRVPPGEWYVMGDNRGRSDDSRFWGPVPAAWIVGRVVR